MSDSKGCRISVHGGINENWADKATLGAHTFPRMRQVKQPFGCQIDVQMEISI